MGEKQVVGGGGGNQAEVILPVFNEVLKGVA